MAAAEKSERSAEKVTALLGLLLVCGVAAVGYSAIRLGDAREGAVSAREDLNACRADLACRVACSGAFSGIDRGVSACATAAG